MVKWIWLGGTLLIHLRYFCPMHVVFSIPIQGIISCVVNSLIPLGYVTHIKILERIKEDFSPIIDTEDRILGPFWDTGWELVKGPDFLDSLVVSSKETFINWTSACSFRDQGHNFTEVPVADASFMFHLLLLKSFQNNLRYTFEYINLKFCSKIVP